MFVASHSIVARPQIELNQENGFIIYQLNQIPQLDLRGFGVLGVRASWGEGPENASRAIQK